MEHTLGQQQSQDQPPKGAHKQQNLVDHLFQAAQRNYFSSSVGQRPKGLAQPVGIAPLPSPARSLLCSGLCSYDALRQDHRSDSEETLRLGESAHRSASEAHR